MSEPPRTVLDAYGNPITPSVLLAAYNARCFPMAQGRDGSIDWYRPRRRAVIRWEDWHVPRSLRKRWRQHPFRLTLNRAFPDVVSHCADRDETWISHDIEFLYTRLQELGLAYSCEAWDADGKLVGGLYGLTIGGCFCGESMFHLANDAAKLCVMFLVHLLRENEFKLLDCQQQTPHMERFGAREIDDDHYAEMFEACRNDPCVLVMRGNNYREWY